MSSHSDHPARAQAPPPPPWEERSARPEISEPSPEASKKHLFRDYRDRHAGFRAKQQSSWLFVLVMIVVVACFVAAIYFKIWEWRPVNVVTTNPL